MKKYLGSLRDIMKMAIPLIIGNLVFMLQNITDKAFLGHLDTVYVSAIGSAQLPYIATTEALIGLGIGITILVSRAYGAGELKTCGKYIKNAIVFFTLIAIAIFALWNLFCYPIMSFFDIEPNVIGYSVSYLKICLLYLPVLAIDNTLLGFLQGIGKTKIIMAGGIIKVFLNIFVSWILIFGKFGMIPLYVDGAAIGTVVANYVSTLFVVLYCFTKYRDVLFSKEIICEKPDLGCFKEIFEIGIFTGIEVILWHGSNLILVKFINGFGYLDMAIYTLSFSVICLAESVYTPICRAGLSIIGQLIGAEKKEKIPAVFYGCFAINFCIILVAVVLLNMFPTELMRIFTTDEQVLANGGKFLATMGFVMFPQAINILCGNGIKAYKDTKWMLLSQILGSVMIVSVSYYLIHFTSMTMTAIVITLFVDESVRGFINYIHYRNLSKGTTISLRRERHEKRYCAL